MNESVVYLSNHSIVGFSRDALSRINLYGGQLNEAVVIDSDPIFSADRIKDFVNSLILLCERMLNWINAQANNQNKQQQTAQAQPQQNVSSTDASVQAVVPAAPQAQAPAQPVDNKQNNEQQ